MSELAEQYIPYVQQNGYRSAKNIVLTGSAGIDLTGSTGTISGGKSKIISGSGATVTLASTQSGSTCLFDRAAGIIYTLPAPIVGLDFTFLAAATVTSNSYKIITDAGTTFISGSVLASIDNTANKSWVGNGTTHLAITQAAASTNATGGIIGSWVRCICVSSTLWVAYGLTIAGGTPTTPFATS